MNTKILFSVIAFASLSLFITSCYEEEDPGPVQQTERTYSIIDFDRVEMGSAFQIDIQQGNFFKVEASGDRRNIEDLDVYKEGATLIIRYRNSRNRRHQTYINITMPEMQAANLSGASDSRISGFEGQEKFKLSLSGASVCQLDMKAEDIEVNLSGASSLSLRGEGESVLADLSGASFLRAFNYTVLRADVHASGGSNASITVSETLDVVASGASVITYRGNPAVRSEVSGASAVRQD